MCWKKDYNSFKYKNWEKQTMKRKAVVFDLDGTLLNTLEDLCNSVNYALDKSGFPTRKLDQVRQDVGNGINNFIRRSLPVSTPEEKYRQVYTDFRLHYRDHCTDFTRPYTGIPWLLTELRRCGVQNAVVSNKADFAVQQLIGRFFPCQFDAVLGERDGIPKKPSPEPIYTALALLDAKPDDAVYIGDSEVDILTAANAKLPCICVDWGFRSRKSLEQAGATHIVSSPEELLKKIMCF